MSSVKTSINCLVISSERKIRAMKTEFTLCQQFSALKVSDVTGNAAHRPEPHTTSANNYWKIKTVAFNCNGSSLQPLGWDSHTSLSANTAASQSQHWAASAAATEHQGLCHTYVMTCCTTVRSWEHPWFPQCIFFSKRRNLLGKFLLMYL